MPGDVVVVVQGTRALKVTDLEAVGPVRPCRNPTLAVKGKIDSPVVAACPTPSPIELRPVPMCALILHWSP